MKRAYGSEPVLLNASPVTPTPQLLKTDSTKKQRKIVWFILAVVLFISGVVGYAMLTEKTSGHVPAAILRKASFPVYTPMWLPTGMLVEPDSFDATSQVVTFSIRDGHGTRLVFTEQPRPTSQEVSTFYDQQLADKTTFKADDREITIGRFEGTDFAAVLLDKTWILVRAVADMNQSDLEKVARQLKLAE